MSEVDQHATPSPAAPARGQIHRTCEAALDYLSGAVVKMIPVLLVCGMLKTAQTLIGPSMLGLVGKADDLYALLGMVYDAGFYFMPIYLGYSCAEKLGGTPVLGSLLGGIMMVPAFAQLASDGVAFSVYGIPCTPVDCSRTVLPIVMSAALLAVLEVHLRKALPEVLAPMFAPLLAMVITLPAALCALGPLGSWCGNALGSALFSLGDRGGLVTVLGVGIIAASWEFLVIAGMRSLLLALGLANMLAVGTDSFVLVGAGVAIWAAFGMALGGFLRLRGTTEGGEALGYFVSGIVGGVTEPALYGLGLRYRRPLIGLAVGGFVGGIWAGATHVTAYVMGSSSFLSILGYVGGGALNTVNAAISDLLAMGIATAVTYVTWGACDGEGRG
ncbi:MAG: PTS transporter subunit EIIC [Tractidigestivibacter sp.]|uniref:PTS transporter subunit EIIC n=1 Tax=Tractidigestivibacter sp. TaxID=2847320 RepID=UPI002A80022A|nr:PTS transporter subunit EIIC [Tractidigestivibacter sp.]MDY4534693.1 PTS transporter subunit EIIC [Tractidigestivibacter sp.]